jgi:low affinity Fe/Cu permease
MAPLDAVEAIEAETQAQNPPVLVRAVSAMTGWLGSTWAIALAILVVLSWASGLFFVRGGLQNTNYGLYINTFTTVVTFIMVFIIQSAQNREGRAQQVKLDAILEAVGGRAALVGIEEQAERDIKNV